MSNGLDAMSVGVFYYEPGVRAISASSSDPMARQDNHNAESLAACDLAGYTTRRSSTFFFTEFGKGDEIADYSYNYAQDGNNVRTVGIFYYEGTGRAASSTGEEALAQQDTHKAESIYDVDEANYTTRTSSTFCRSRGYLRTTRRRATYNITNNARSRKIRKTPVSVYLEFSTSIFEAEHCRPKRTSTYFRQRNDHQKIYTNC